MEERPSVYVSELSRRGLARRRARIRRSQLWPRLAFLLAAAAAFGAAVAERIAG
jgi:hypothetical protein